MALANGLGSTKFGTGTTVGTSTPTSRAGYGDYNKAKAMAKDIAIKTNNSVSDIRNRAAEITGRNNEPQTKYVYVNSGSNSGGGGGGYSGGNGEDIVSMIKSLLEEQKKAADEYANSLYQQAYAKAEQESEANRNANNLSYMRADRYLKSLYGTGSTVGGGDPSTKFGGGNISGQGLSNQYRNYSNWQNRGTAIRQDLVNNKNTLEAQRNANLMNNAGTLASGWYNYVLPYYSQDALNRLDYAYRSSLL